MQVTPRITTTDLLCLERGPGPCAAILFGASGDLARRKLLPALAALAGERRLLPEHFFLLGYGRTPLTDADFARQVTEACPGAAGQALAGRCFYQTGGYDDAAGHAALAARLAELELRFGTGGNRAFYLALPPELYAPVCERLAAAGLTTATPATGPWRRVVVEKPFGRDLRTADELDQRLARVLRPEQLYRIDHYLGKDTVQNILMLRFANRVFAPIWNRDSIDHVQITVAEEVGVGHRAGYFDATGVLRDMCQNHLLQLLALVAMDAPPRFDAAALEAEKLRLLDTLRPWTPARIAADLVRGQYGAGPAGAGYCTEPGVPADSATETYLAARLFVDDWRWAGVPFYLRTGKRLAKRVTEIALTLKPVPHSIFAPLNPEDLAPNVLVMRVQPDEGIELTIQAKRPGPKLCMSAMNLDVSYREAFKADPPDAYQRLLLDVMLGDQTLFLSGELVRRSWQFWQPVLDAWAAAGADGICPLQPYPAGSWGPPAAARLLADDGRRWRLGA
jgi:glucose-6-phosphate 1-dehydrogenase